MDKRIAKRWKRENRKNKGAATRARIEERRIRKRRECYDVLPEEFMCGLPRRDAVGYKEF